MRNMENGEVIISGYLGKSPPESKLRNLRSWTKRFFVLYKNKQLCYYKNDKEKKPIKDPIQLNKCKCIEANLNHEKFDFVFSVVTDKRTYYLVADTKNDMETWVEKLCSACGFERNQTPLSPDLKASPKPNEYGTSQARPQPIASKARTMSPVGMPSSFSSSGSSLTSPTGPCPLSIPKYIMDSQNKVRSMSDPPEPSPEAPQCQRGKFRRQSEQIVSNTLPVNVQGMQNKARLSGNLSENYNTVPSPRPLSGDVYDNLPSPKKKVSHTMSSSGLEKRLEAGIQDNYDDVPIPRALDHVSSPLSPRQKSGHHLSPDDYDHVPTPRPISQSSNRSSQDVYDIVPPPRPMSSCSQDGKSLYDVPPVGKGHQQDNYDMVPTPRPMSFGSEEGEGLYDIPPTGKQENYDIVPSISRPVAPKPSHLQSDSPHQNYDVVPVRQSIYDTPPVGRISDQENYDIVPPLRPVAPKPGASRDNYDVVPKRQASHFAYNGQSAGDVLFSEQENYDIVPPIHRPVAPKPNHSQQGTSNENYDVVPMRQTWHSGYDNLPSERASTQENYDIVPPVQRPVSMKPSHMQPYTSQETYDVVPIPRPSNENYDFVPTPRAISTANQPENLTSNHSSGFARSSERDLRFSDIYSVPPNSQSRDSHEWVSTPQRPFPYQPRKDGYDPLPNTNRPVSADSGLNASFSSICSLKSEGDYGHEDRYDAPLPELPSHARDSGSLSDEMPDDDLNPEIYDTPPNWESRNSIYAVPPKQESDYDVLPSHPNEIYDTAPMMSDEIYDVPPNREQDVPVVDRSTKRPPLVNRAVKPKTLTEDHSYCNIPPKVDRESKKKGMVPQPEHSYINMGAPPPRPKHLPLVKVLPGNPYVGSLPNQPARWSTGPADDEDYCPMQPPTRSEMTRCYSLTKEEKPRSRSPGNDQCYVDMSAVQTRRYSGGKSTSSSSSSLADNDDLYMPMVPNHHGSFPSQQVEQRHRKDLLYAEVEILEGAHHAKASVPTPPRRENTHYTYINEESTRALLQTSHARQGNR